VTLSKRFLGFGSILQMNPMCCIFRESIQLVIYILLFHLSVVLHHFWLLSISKADQRSVSFCIIFLKFFYYLSNVEISINLTFSYEWHSNHISRSASGILSIEGSIKISLSFNKRIFNLSSGLIIQLPSFWKQSCIGMIWIICRA